MKAVQIDFAAPSLRRTLFRTGPMGWTLCALALLLCVAAGSVGYRLWAQQRANVLQLAALKPAASAPAPVLPASAPAPQISEAQASVVNAAVLQLNLPWRALRDAIGAATPAEVALLALEPDARKHSIKITAEAKTSDAMIAYIEQLKQQELFVAVTLVRHEINDQDPNKPIRFQLEAQWTP
ncbi:MAG: PilN domain-containing protein [Pseudomonadota bacterium]